MTLPQDAADTEVAGSDEQMVDIGDAHYIPDEDVELPPEDDGIEAQEDDAPADKGSTPEPDKTPEKPQWDKDRQARDEQRAREHRELVESNKELRSQLAELAAAMKSAGKKPEETPAELAELLDENSDAEQIATTIKQLNAEKKELRQAVDSLKEQVDQLTKKTAAKEGVDTADQFLATLDKQYGAKFRNAAIDMAKKDLAEDGYGDGPVPWSAMKAALRGAYKLAAAQNTAKPTGKPNLPIDPAAGGSTAPDADEASLTLTVKDAWKKQNKRKT